MIGLDAALSARPAAGDARIGYREEIFHPALPAPAAARGWFEEGADGALLRHQTAPDAETISIGDRFMRLSREADGFSNIVPIPSELIPLFDILRAIVAHNPPDGDTLRKTFAVDLENGPTGWALTLAALPSGTPAATAMPVMVLGGCGAELQSVEWRLPDSTRRRYIFETAP